MLNKETSNSFNKYFCLTFAHNAQLMAQVHKIRYDVFCTELGLEKGCPVGAEKDEFDAYSYHYLLQHKATGKYAGTVRMVLPPNGRPDLLLPIEKYCLDSIDPSIIDISKLPRGSFAEVSRLAVPKDFRKRAGEEGKPYIVSVDGDQITKTSERRHFPHISIGLYLAAASLFELNRLDYIFVMVEPRLTRSLKRVGLHFEQMGEVIEYHGLRAPFYITPEMLNKHLKPDLKKLYNGIIEQVSNDLKKHEYPTKIVSEA